MVLTTTDTLPQTFDVVGLVQVTFVAVPPAKAMFAAKTSNVTQDSLRKAESELASQANAQGADAVIGVRVQSLFGNNCVLMGTAVKYRA